MPTRSPAQKDSAPTTAVVIATYKRAALLDRVLADLAAAPLPDAVTDILVVENGDPDDTRSVCERYSDAIPLRYHHVSESGKSNALNVALALTDADFVIQFDDDVRVDPGTVRAFVDVAGRLGPGHFFGGPVSPEYEGAPPAAWLRPWLTTCVVGWDLGREERPYHEFLGANWAAFRSDLLAAGGFLTGLGPSATYRTVGEEVEMQQRLTDAGCRGVYVPEAGVQHFVRREQCTLGWLKRRWSQHSLSQVMLSPMYIDAPSIAGAPRFLWRQWLSDWGKVLAARLTGPRSERRLRLERVLALTRGQIAGYRRVREVGRVSSRGDRSLAT